MATAEQLLTAATDSAKELVEDGVLKFREGEDQTEMINPAHVATLIKTLSDTDVVAAINGAAQSPSEDPSGNFFEPLC